MGSPKQLHSTARCDNEDPHNHLKKMWGWTRTSVGRLYLITKVLLGGEGGVGKWILIVINYDYSDGVLSAKMKIVSKYSLNIQLP